jgi:hypothetical protein
MAAITNTVFVSGEVPSVSVWNTLPQNDAILANGTGITALTIGSVTNVTNPYKFSVYQAGAWTSGNGVVLLIMDTKLFDTGSNYSVSTGLFTAPVNGFYSFSGFANLTAIGASTGVGAGFAVTSSIGGNRTQNHVIGLTGNGTFGYGAGAATFLELNAGDTVGFAFYGSGNAGASGTNNTGFGGFLVSNA